jgi:hypothetical protein
MPEVVPNFFIVGAAKAGTTSLYTYLGEHPQVFMSPVKEPHFFSRGMSGFTGKPSWSGATIVRDWDQYHDLFSGVRQEIAIGEASPTYLPDPETPGRIRQHIPDARIIITLRDPINRAYSHFQLLRRLGIERSSDFLEAVMAEERGEGNDLRPYFGRSRYAPKLQRYMEHFPADQIQIHLYDDLKADTAAVVRSVFGFLGVDDRYEPDTSRRYHRGGEVRRPRLQAFMNDLPRPVKSATTLLPDAVRMRAYWRLHDWNMRAVPLPSVVRQQLLPLVRDDIVATQDLIGRDLSSWLDPGA